MTPVQRFGGVCFDRAFLKHLAGMLSVAERNSELGGPLPQRQLYCRYSNTAAEEWITYFVNTLVQRECFVTKLGMLCVNDFTIVDSA